MTFHVTAIRPADPDFWMPTIDQYTALAEAMHDGRDDCNANYVLPFSECVNREADINDAVAVLTELRKVGWKLSRDPAGTTELGL